VDQKQAWQSVGFDLQQHRQLDALIVIEIAVRSEQRQQLHRIDKRSQRDQNFLGLCLELLLDLVSARRHIHINQGGVVIFCD
jgi:hypothetical protein